MAVKGCFNNILGQNEGNAKIFGLYIVGQLFNQNCLSYMEILEFNTKQHINIHKEPW